MFSKSDDKSKTEPQMSTKKVIPGTAGPATPSIISADLRVIGNLESDGDLQVDGQVEGDIRTRSVIVGEGAHVKGAILADSVRVCGAVTGQIKAASVTLAGTAMVKGDVIQQSFSVEAGASLEGRVSRHDSAKDDSRPEATGVRPIHEEAAAKAAQAVGSAGNGEMSRKPAAG